MKNKISLIIIFSLSCFIFIGCATNVSTVKDKGHTVSLSEIELFLADSVFFKSSIVVPFFSSKDNPNVYSSRYSFYFRFSFE